MEKNMTLQSLKEDINKAGFSEETLALINAKLDQAIARGKLEKMEKEEIQAIMDLEIEAAKLENDTKKQIAVALNEFADGVEGAIAAAIDEIEALEKDSTAVKS
jgi:hypothetical protein